MTLGWYPRLLQTVLMRVRPNLLAAKIKSWLGVKRVPLGTDHGTFWIDPVSLLGIALSRRGVHEDGMVKTLQTLLKPGDTFVDLGANEGYFSVIAARLCGASGRVLAIEPQQRLLPVIQENLRLNQSQSVALLNAAVGAVEGTAVMHLTASTNTGGSGFERRSKFALPTQEVAMHTLEQVLDQQGIAQVDLMKVDIEGFEYEALLGSPRVFEQQRVKAVALELHPTLLADRGKDAADITALLARCGYEAIQKFGNSVWIATSTPKPGLAA